MEQKQRVLLIGININNQAKFEESIEELKNLAAACDMEIVGKLEQKLKAVNKAFYIGPGKVEEVTALINETQADVVIFDNELSPSQLRNLEKALDRKIMDRTSLILEIFSSRAKTREAKLQVEVAHLQYMLPRLIGGYEALGRQSGGVGTKNRGEGEKKLELDRRKIEEKIFYLNKELEMLGKERETQRKKRNKSDLPTVALVGYTNSGKSTIMNAMLQLSQKPTAKMVFEKDMLFATLETSVRNITLPDNKAFLLSDTVGFVSKLPHNLVKAFRSTLEEVREADLILHVVDISNSNYEQQIEVTNDTLKQIGAEGVPTIYVYNKIDLLTMDVPLSDSEKVYISAKEKIGLDEMVQLIGKKVFKHYMDCKVLIPYDRGDIVAYFNENAYVKSVEYMSKGTLLTVECSESDFRLYEQYACLK